jgi:predicted DNA-binding transcriptional regulator AlpA
MDQEQSPQQLAFIRIAKVREISGLSKSTIWRWIEATPSRFPSPVVREGNTVLWDLAEVIVWREAQFKKRNERIQAQAEARA